ETVRTEYRGWSRAIDERGEQVLRATIHRVASCIFEEENEHGEKMCVVRGAPHELGFPLREDATSGASREVMSRILRGGSVLAQRRHGFTHIGDGAGAEQVLPLAVSNEQLRAAQVPLDVCHYYEADAETGAVRIAATRLVRLMPGGAHGG